MKERKEYISAPKSARTFKAERRIEKKANNIGLLAKFNSEKKIKDKLRLKLYARDGKNCHYCGIKEGDFISIWGKFYKGRGKILELDRKDNRKGYTEENCVLACAICNNAKSNKFTCEEFEKVGKTIKEIWLYKKDKNFKRL